MTSKWKDSLILYMLWTQIIHVWAFREVQQFVLSSFVEMLAKRFWFDESFFNFYIITLSGECYKNVFFLKQKNKFDSVLCIEFYYWSNYTIFQYYLLRTNRKSADNNNKTYHKMGPAGRDQCYIL